MELTDKDLHPYKIIYDTNSYTLVEERVNQKNDEIYNNTIGYFINIESAIDRVIKLKVSDKDYNSLSEYIDEIKRLKTNFKLN